MATLLINEVVDTKKIYHSFQDFLAGNSVLGTTAGIVVGLGTYTAIRSATFDIVLPALHLLFLGGVKFIHKPTYLALSKVFPNTEFQWIHFIGEFMSWVVLLFATFAVVQYVMRWIVYRKERKVDSTQMKYDTAMQ
jgi:large-conductance mechanosensitive channel